MGSVGIAHDLVERMGIFCSGKAIANRADYIRHAAVIAHPVLGNGPVVAHQAQEPGSQLLFHVGEVEDKQLAEYLEVRQGNSGDAPLLDSSAFGGKREGILIGQKHEGQVALPKVPIEGISRRHVQQVLHLHVHHREQGSRCSGPFFELPGYVRQLTQDALPIEFAEDDQPIK